MTDTDHLQNLRELETRVRQLMLDYRALRAENMSLRRRADEAQSKLEEEKARSQTLNRELSALRMAQVVKMEDGDIKEARSRINRMIREVDKCIALLG